MATLRSDPKPPPRLRPMALAGLAATLVVIAGALAWGRFDTGAGDAGAAAVDRSGAIVRRTEVAFADAQSVWGRMAEAEGRRYDPAELLFFTRATGTPCAGGGAASGPFYCPETGTAGFDLDFLAALGRRLGRQEDLGMTLVAARLSAAHLERELGRLDAAAMRMIAAPRARRDAIAAALALEADCLTGAWAAAAEPRLGPVPAEFWGQLVWSWRNSVEAFAETGVRVASELDPFAAGDRDERAAAFARGYAAGGIAGCPAPAEIASGG